MSLRTASTLLVACSFVCLQSAHAQKPAPATPDPHPPSNFQAQLAYTSYYVLDEKRALDFYVGLLGMNERQRITPSPGVTEILLGFDQDRNKPGILLMHRADRKTPYQIGDGFSRTIIHVTDVKAMVQRLAQAQVAIVRQPTEVASLNLTYAMVRDPDGYLIEFVQTQ
jgi:lactoylglutathione lyase